MNKILSSSLVVMSVLFAGSVHAEQQYMGSVGNNGYYYGSIRYVDRFVRHTTDYTNNNNHMKEQNAYSYHTPTLSWAFGRKTETGLRFDVEFVEGVEKKIGIHRDKISTMSFNLYYDFSNRSVFTPYVGMGAGLALIQTRVNLTVPPSSPDNENKSMSDLYHSISLGTSIRLTKVLELDVGYRYADYGRDISASNEQLSNAKQRLSGNELFTGIRFKF